jgi:GNAT superfamily N-acetyltransferase
MLSIRTAAREDSPVILRFIHALAGMTGPGTTEVQARVRTTEEDIVRDGFGDEPCFRALLSEWDSEPIGMALYWFGWSTWRGRPVLHLEDLVVEPAHRRRGVGRALMRELAVRAVERGCARFQWPIVKRDDPAFPFYESLGARVLWEWPMVGLEGDALAQLASTA